MGWLEIPGTPAALSTHETLYVGYALGQDFRGCALPVSKIKNLLASRSNPDDHTTFAFNQLLGANPAVPGNWCWTKLMGEFPKWVETDPVQWGDRMFEHK